MVKFGVVVDLLFELFGGWVWFVVEVFVDFGIF